MKVTYQGENGFLIEDKKIKVICNPPESFSTETDFATRSTPGEDQAKFETKKVLCQPGEFEISQILVKGIFSDRRTNVVFKIVSDDIAVAHLGHIEDIPPTEWFENLGENVALVMIHLSEKLNGSQAKELIDKIDPRFALISGDKSQFPKLSESGAKTAEEESVTISKSSLAEDRRDIILFG